jgi:DNA-binding MarR family transcriptional regulator/N-acetylglutamate synthase-like GNAT family acetyltransferase
MNQKRRNLSPLTKRFLPHQILDSVKYLFQDLVMPGLDAIDLIRDFNRFYTRQLGLLDRGLLGSDFTLTEARVLYELAHRELTTAADIAQALALDVGYLSRILKQFETQLLLARKHSSIDARQRSLKLSAKGRRAFAALNNAAREQVAELIGPLSEERRTGLVKSMQSIMSTLEPSQTQKSYSVRGLKIGDIGWIVHRQGLLYAKEYGWDSTYEALVAEIAGNFIKNFDAEFERAWVAEQDSKVVGCVFIVRVSAQIAKLRLLYVEPEARGLGIGRRLVQDCIRFARAKGYKTLTLWTNDVLVAARHVYLSAGFQLVREEPNQAFGKDLISQTWELALEH